MAMIAELTGMRYFIPEQLLKYRQHQASSIASSIASSDNRNKEKIKDRYINYTIKISLSNYKHAENDFKELSWTEEAVKNMNDYFYLFGNGSKIKKLYILIKNKYSFYRRLDLIRMMLIILMNKNLKSNFYD